MLDFLIHIEQWLPPLIEHYGLWIYAILFLIILIETGSVFMFFLPGDSLLLAIGALCTTTDVMHLIYIGPLLCIAAILGYIINYYTGRLLGFKFFHAHSRFLKPEYIAKTDRYFTQHGGKTILIARFVPFVRSFAPFAAGAGQMYIFSFMLYNILGSVVWISLLLAMGYGLGNILGVAVDLLPPTT